MKKDLWWTKLVVKRNKTGKICAHFTETFTFTWKLPVFYDIHHHHHHNNNNGINMGINEWINFSLVSFSWYRKLLKWLWKKFSWSIMKFFVYKNKLHSHLWIMYPSFFYKKNFYKKMSLKNPKTLRKCWENVEKADFS